VLLLLPTSGRRVVGKSTGGKAFTSQCRDGIRVWLEARDSALPQREDGRRALLTRDDSVVLLELKGLAIRPAHGYD
jgi:hypothetical protein